MEYKDQITYPWAHFRRALQTPSLAYVDCWKPPLCVTDFVLLPSYWSYLSFLCENIASVLKTTSDASPPNEYDFLCLLNSTELGLWTWILYNKRVGLGKKWVLQLIFTKCSGRRFTRIFSCAFLCLVVPDTYLSVFFNKSIAFFKSEVSARMDTLIH